MKVLQRLNIPNATDIHFLNQLSLTSSFRRKIFVVDVTVAVVVVVWNVRYFCILVSMPLCCIAFHDIQTIRSTHSFYLVV